MEILTKKDKEFLALLAQLKYPQMLEYLDENKLLEFMQTVEELKEKGMKVGHETGDLTLDWNWKKDQHGRLAKHTEGLIKLGFQFTEGIDLGEGWQRGYFQWHQNYLNQ